MPAQPVLCNNWPEQYPYSPLVQFRIAHNDQEFYCFDVTEKYTMVSNTITVRMMIPGRIFHCNLRGGILYLGI
ncbi:MAG: hypothetical protein ACLTXP_10555 [Odoribacter splanchnicus]